LKNTLSFISNKPGKAFPIIGNYVCRGRAMSHRVKKRTPMIAAWYINNKMYATLQDHYQK
jgi:hypothetical protein